MEKEVDFSETTEDGSRLTRSDKSTTRNNTVSSQDKDICFLL